MWYRWARKKRTKIMVAFYVPRNAAKEMALCKSDLHDGADIQEHDELHLTLAMLGEAEELKEKKNLILSALEHFAQGMPPLSGKVSGVGAFNHTNQEGYSPLYASFDAPELPGFREHLLDALQAAGAEADRTHGFTPHITLGYFDAEKAAPIMQMEPLSITFPQVSLAWAGERHDFPLKG